MRGLCVGVRARAGVCTTNRDGTRATPPFQPPCTVSCTQHGFLAGGDPRRWMHRFLKPVPSQEGLVSGGFDPVTNKEIRQCISVPVSWRRADHAGCCAHPGVCFRD